MQITFLGTPKFSQITLQKMLEEGIEVKGVVTREDKKKGRGQHRQPSPVKELAQKKNIPVHYSFKEVQDTTDLAIVAGYGQIIEKQLLSIPKHGFLNMHPSLLPKYRGPSPIQNIILDGKNKTGVSVIVMTSKVDAGPIVGQESIQLEEEYYYSQLEEKLARLGGKMLAKTIPDWVNNKLETQSQNEEEATSTSLIDKSEGEVDWTQSSDYIERKVRAYRKWPGCYTYLDGQLLKILEAEVQEQTQDGPFGEPGKTYLGTNNTIAVQTGEDFLRIKRLQLENNSATTAKSFLQGHDDLIGKVLG